MQAGRIKLLHGFVSLLMVMGILTTGGKAYAQLADAPWPKFGQNVENTGQSPFGEAGASWQAGDIGTARTGPSIASDGTIYIAAGAFREETLYALDPETGEQEWDFAPGNFSARSVQPVVDGEGTIYIGGDSSGVGLLYALNPNGTEKWQRPFFAFDPVRTAPTIASDGTVYVMTGDFSSNISQVHAVDPATGQAEWVVDIGTSTSSPTIASDGTIYVGTNGGEIFEINPDTEEAVPLETTLDGAVQGIAIGEGTLYVSFGSNQLAAIDPAADEELWSATADLFSITPPVLGPNGRIFVGVSGEVDGAVYAFNTDGNELWSRPTNGLVDAAPAVAGGVVYAGYSGNNSELLALNSSDGSTIWSFSSDASIRQPLALASDGTVYLGTFDGLFSVIGPEATISPSSLDFGIVATSSSSTREVTVENVGDADLEITDVSISGSNAGMFAVTGGGDAGTLAPGQTRTITIEFSPSSAGDKSATLTVESNADPVSTSLSGTGIAPPSATTNSASDVRADGAMLNGTVNPGGAETEVIFEYGLTTDYGTTVTAAESPLSGTEEQAVSAAIDGLQPGTTYHYRVVASNEVGTAEGENETFTTRTPELAVTPSTLSFGRVGVQDTSDAQPVAIENTGNASLSISNVALSSTTHFQIRDDTGESTLDPGDMRTVEVTFKPDSSGVLSATLTIESNARSATVELSGTGVSLSVPENTLAVAGEPREITVAVSEGFQAQTGVLHYRRGGEQGYDQVELVPAEESDFTGTIPASAVTERGIDFYVELADEDLTVTFPADNPAEHPEHLQTQSASLAAEGSFEPGQYRMISVPTELGDGSVEAVLSEYGDPNSQRWRLLRWDSQIGEDGAYRELESERELPALETSFAPGVAFWLITREGQGFNVEDARSVDGSESFPIQLQSGYNQIANPFAFPVRWSQIEAPEGVDAPREAHPPHDVASVLQPWQGYWIFNRNAEPVELSVPPVEASSDEVVAAQKDADENDLPFADTPDYALQLVAELDEEEREMLADRYNYVGWSEDATAHFGAEDIPEVPPVGEHVRLSIMEDGMRLAGSLRPSDTEGQTWTLEVAANSKEPFFRRKMATVRLRDHGTRPPNYQLRLIDIDSERVISVESGQFAVTLTADQPVRRLRLVLGTAQFADRETSEVEPQATSLRAAYPNPSGGAVSVDYQLSEAGRVEMTVYDMLGRRVRTLVEGRQSAGRHTAQWDGRRTSGAPVASGVYVIRMQAGSFTEARRIVLVR